MRIIKFRAWADKEKEMVYSAQGELNNPFDYWAGWDKKTHWMQFTGLLDKNGKEIYEGDIVEWNGDPDTNNEFYRTPNGIYEVIWKWTGFLLVDKSNCKFTPKPGEVIGNIYENPELFDDR